jgi:hypothetical protein
MSKIKKFTKEYALMTAGEKEVNIDVASSIMVFFIVVAFILAIVFQYDVTVNIVWFLGIILALTFFMSILIMSHLRFHSAHIFAPHFTWSAMLTNMDSTTMIYDGVEVNFAIYPLMGAISRGFVPIPGGGRHGFLVVDSSLIIDMEGNIGIYADIFPTRVAYLPKDLRARVMQHNRYKGDPKRVRAYFAVQPYGKTSYELHKFLDSLKLDAMGNLRAMMMSLIRENTHLNALLNSSLAREKYSAGKGEDMDIPPRQE